MSEHVTEQDIIGSTDMQFINTYDIARLAHVGLICGFEMDELLRDIGVSASECAAPPDVHWEASLLGRLFASGMKLSRKAHFPFVVGEHFQFDRTPEVDAFLSTSATLAQALDICRYVPHIVQPDTMVWAAEEGELVHIHVELQQSGVRIDNPGYIETVIVAMIRLARRISASISISGVSLRHRPLQALDVYERQFGSVPQFGEQCNRVSLPRHLLSKPLEGASPSLHAQAELLLQRRVNKFMSPGTMAQTLETMLMQTPTISIREVAEQLGLEPRSLQRRLKEEGVSFNAVLASSRYALARLFLSDPYMDMDAIASKLGFADRNSFSKAFSKWAGTPPSQFRRMRQSM